MKENYHKSAQRQDPEFLGASKPAVESQPLSALSERDATVATETTLASRQPWTCPLCGELLRLIRVYPSGRGFEMRCEGTDSNPHRAILYEGPCRKGEALRILAGALYKC